MPDPALLTVVPLAVLIFAWIFIGYPLLQKFRGSLKVRLQQAEFEPNSTIQGELRLKTRRSIEAQRLVLTLAGFVTSHRDGRVDMEYIYKNEVLLEGEKTYEAGYGKTYAFSFLAPALPTISEKMPKGTILSSVLGFLLKYGLVETPRIYWHVKAQLFSRGIDLTDTRPIVIKPPRTRPARQN